MFNGHKLIKEETLRLDHDETALVFTKDNSEEDRIMTKEEFVAHLIRHAETFPVVDEIANEDAQAILDNLVPDSNLPEVTAAELTSLWNRLVHDPNVTTID